MSKKNGKNGNGENGNGADKKPVVAKPKQECVNKRQALTQLRRLKWDVEFRNDNQQKFFQTIESNDVTFCSGPAGCGKTYLAVYYALQALGTKGSPYNGIIIVKPLVEADGEKLGFLPGDIEEKTEPFMWSYYYNIEQVVGKTKMNILLAESVIQIMPLAYMRGITLSEKIVILDESQNTTPEQVKMFLTRIGDQSKYIICGDLDQTDRKITNGLEDAMRRFTHLDGVGFTTFSKEDIVRHEIVGRLLDRYQTQHYN